MRHLNGVLRKEVIKLKAIRIFAFVALSAVAIVGFVGHNVEVMSSAKVADSVESFEAQVGANLHALALN